MIFGLSSYAQKTEIIEVDSITMQPSKNLPFDVPFILKVKIKAKPEFVLLAEHKKFKTLAQSWNSLIYNPKNKFCEIPEEHLTYEKGYLYIRFDRLPYKYDNSENENSMLKPSRGYTLIMPNMLEGTMELYEKLYEYSQNGTENSLDEALELYRTADLNQMETYGYSFLLPMADWKAEEESLEKKEFNDEKKKRKEDKINDEKAIEKEDFKEIVYQDHFVGSILTDFATFDGHKTSLENRDALNFTNGLKAMAEIVNLNNFIHTCDSNILSCCRKEICDLELFLAHYYSESNACYKKVVLGINTLLDRDCTTPESVTNDLRIKNLKSSIKLIAGYEETLKLLIIKGSTDAQTLLTSVSSMKTELSTTKTNLDDLVSSRKKIFKKEVETGMIESKSAISATTTIFDYDTRAKMQITPDFGYIYSGFNGDFNHFSPYLGFHVNFRFMDKNLPFWGLPNKTPFHFVSFMTGWSLVSIAEDGKRADLFKDNKGTLLTGLGFRITNSLRITGGVNWFYKIDPNPLINTKSLAVMPFCGLSLDLDLKKYLNGFMDLIPNKRK